MGDRLRVIVPSDRMAEVSAYLGDSDRGMSDINVGGLALGLAAGIALGLVHVPTPGGGFTIGAAAGTLMVGLVFGRLGRVGPVITSMSHGAAQSLSALGMVTFLAYAGVRAGRNISAALASDAGWRVAVLGLVLTSAGGALLLFGIHVLRRMSWLETAGAIAGSQTQPAILAYVNDKTGYDTRIGVAYALVYPVAMIAKIIVAQVLAGL
jgi:putative transport protein